MALGWDTALAEAALNNNIYLVVAIPFKGQECMWSKQSQDIYNNIISKANERIIVCPGAYHVSKMQIRNEWMVDHCDTLLALWDGTNGGTGNCIKYANSINKPIINLWDKFK